MEYIEHIVPWGYSLIQDQVHFRLGQDSVFLAAFPDYKRNMRICDLGCGTGALLLLAAGRAPDGVLDGLELLPSAAELARRSVALSGLEGRVRVITGDVAECERLLTSKSYDLVLSNPPYFSPGKGKPSASQERSSAREGKDFDLQQLCRAASILLKPGGRLAVVYRCEELGELMYRLRCHGLEAKRLRFIQHRAESAAKTFLLEAVLGGMPGLKAEPPLIIKNADGSDTQAVKNIYLGR